ncbi:MULTISPECIES: serine hydrolase domain-containing protein [unclassified Pseudoalteromonas]|uniref:serine hydrolase domain-containing protein n=1 Tax=unclassified Pseudoalteromonas TaxID=194690 RepID=UPI000C07B5DF|nr:MULTISPECIES: serine hydrolase domain-containing protein [unclassified Pseudoalteromonas]MDP2635679.1 serine hydrolase domain-containing protein [Pseudoalteromonas sp. 1_MG-2023]PHN91615.1 serine hydrolase [Pseudoalteromonas sp. 3D05]
MIKSILVISALVLAKFVTAEEITDVSELTARLDNAVPKILDKHKAPGVAIALVNGNGLVGFRSYGFADVATKTQITQRTMFNVGSISKLVTAWGVMQLVAQDKVDLDAPINQYLKRWQIPNAEFDVQKVTLRNVLSHTSGLSLGPYSGWDSREKLSSIVDSLKGDNNNAGPVELIHAPDTKWSYSGGGYSVVQLLIEDVSGMTFDDYMQKYVFGPLNMQDSTFNITEKVMNKSATPYDNTGRITGMVYFNEKAAAGLQTTPRDLARFNMAVLRNKEGHYNGLTLLSEKLIDQMIKPAPNTNGRWSMSYVVDAENNSLGFAGFNRGWVSLSRSVTDLNFGYVILNNSSIGAVNNEIDSLILSTVK